MKINNIDGLTFDQLNYELKNGAKFVVFQYCISILIMTFKRGSDIYFIRSGESTFTPVLIYTLVSLIFGWWGIPWGPIYTISSVFSNLTGGKDVTPEVLNALKLHSMKMGHNSPTA